MEREESLMQMEAYATEAEISMEKMAIAKLVKFVKVSLVFTSASQPASYAKDERWLIGAANSARAAARSSTCTPTRSRRCRRQGYQLGGARGAARPPCGPSP